MLTSVPEIDECIRSAFEYMKNDPKHHLQPGLRKNIYTSFTEALGSEVRQSMHGWLAILAARRVLPIFEAFEANSALPQWYFDPEYPHDAIPKDLLALAENILKSEIDKEHLPINLGKVHIETGNFWGLREEDVPNNAYFAGSAAYLGLLEVSGLNLLDRLNPKYLMVFQPNDSSNPMAGNNITDYDLVFSSLADTAAEAAMAESIDENGKLDSDRLFTFWSWWLLEAIPEAYNKATEK